MRRRRRPTGGGGCGILVGWIAGAVTACAIFYLWVPAMTLELDAKGRPAAIRFDWQQTVGASLVERLTRDD